MGNHISTSPPTDRTFTFMAQQIDAKLTTLFDDLAGLMIDASGNTATRSTYDAEAKGFVYYDSQAGVIYQKQSATSADWSDAFQFETGALQNIVEDTSPQLGGALDVNGQQITSSANIDLKLGDAAGANIFNVRDSSGGIVAKIDSNGATVLQDSLTVLRSADPTNQFWSAAQTANLRVRSVNLLGGNIIDIDSEPLSPNLAFIRMFRNTNTTGDVVFYVLKGDATTGSNHALAGNNSLNSYLCGNNGTLSIGLTTNPSGAQLSVDGAIAPAVDDTYDLGTASYRWDDVYATNATIQTSDENEKEDFKTLDEAEQRVAIACKGLIRSFKWKASNARKKGKGRKHVGATAQDVKAAFESEGLDAGDYGIFTESVWWEAEVTEVQMVDTETPGEMDTEIKTTYVKCFKTEAEAPKGAVRKTSLGLRYTELLAFIISAL